MMHQFGLQDKHWQSLPTRSDDCGCCSQPCSSNDYSSFPATVMRSGLPCTSSMHSWNKMLNIQAGSKLVVSDLSIRTAPVQGLLPLHHTPDPPERQASHPHLHVQTEPQSTLRHVLMDLGAWHDVCLCKKLVGADVLLPSG